MQTLKLACGWLGLLQKTKTEVAELSKKDCAFSYIVIPLPPNTVGEGIMFLFFRLFRIPFVRPFVPTHCYYDIS